MFEEYEKQKRKQITFRRSLMDYAMGLIFLIIGILFFFRDRLHLAFLEDYPPNELDKIFGIMCMLYGSWRIYRGYKKNYFR